MNHRTNSIHLSDERVLKYQALYFEVHKKPIAWPDAYREFMSLVLLVRTVHEHMEEHQWPELPPIEITERMLWVHHYVNSPEAMLNSMGIF